MITENNVPKCLNCAPPTRPKHIVKPPPTTDVPSNSEFAKLIGETVVNQPIIGKANLITTGGTALDALNIMRNLPMPKNMKEFRQIQKIIKQLEKLVGEEHAE
jgi:hypothetical protein